MPKKKLNKFTSPIGSIHPTKLTLALILQFAGCLHIEKGLHIPDNTFFLN